MGKSKKNNPQAELEKLQRQIAKEFEENNFSSIEEANKYIQDKYMGKKIDDIETKSFTPEDIAQNLIYEAMESEDGKEKISLAENALEIDKNCADAYNILAVEKSQTQEEALEYYEKGIEAGKKSLGGQFEEFRGEFWGFHETRPFMRAMAGYADALWLSDRREESIKTMQEMLSLNPNDNQGVRHDLITRLLIMNHILDAEKLFKEYENDYSCQWKYSLAYIYFNKRSKKMMADKALKEAMRFNPYVPMFLAGVLELPREMPQYVGIGDANEAVYYVDEAFELWGTKEKVATWFVEIYHKMEPELKKLVEDREKEKREKL